MIQRTVSSNSTLSVPTPLATRRCWGFRKLPPKSPPKPTAIGPGVLGSPPRAFARPGPSLWLWGWCYPGLQVASRGGASAPIAPSRKRLACPNVALALTRYETVLSGFGLNTCDVISNANGHIASTPPSSRRCGRFRAGLSLPARALFKALLASDQSPN